MREEVLLKLIDSSVAVTLTVQSKPRHLGREWLHCLSGLGKITANPRCPWQDMKKEAERWGRTENASDGAEAAILWSSDLKSPSMAAPLVLSPFSLSKIHYINGWLLNERAFSREMPP